MGVIRPAREAAADVGLPPPTAPEPTPSAPRPFAEAASRAAAACDDSLRAVCSLSFSGGGSAVTASRKAPPRQWGQCKSVRFCVLGIRMDLSPHTYGHTPHLQRVMSAVT